MAKISKISDKLAKINDTFVVNIYDNGYMIEASGRDSAGEWVTAKILCSTKDELLNLVVDATDLERDN